MVDRETLYCDCCGTQGMAYREPDRLVIRRRANRKDHVLIVRLDKIEKRAVALPQTP